MLFGLGYGLGAMVGEMQGTSYFAFLAAGFVATSTMYAASFESLYSAFSRMHVQRTWEAIVNAPVTLDDVLAGEYAWAATKALAAGACMLIIVAAFGYAKIPWLFAALPVIVLIGLAFAGMGLVVNALAHGYDFFSYYMTLVLTPMMMLSGVFFPAGADAGRRAGGGEGAAALPRRGDRAAAAVGRTRAGPCAARRRACRLRHRRLLPRHRAHPA